MKALVVLILLSLLSLQVEAKNGVSLNEAVNQVKSEGRVLSAKTINGRHEIKVLTPSGTVKTINKTASGRVYSNPNAINFDHQQPQTIHNKYRDSPLPSRLKNNRNVMKLKEQNPRSRRGSDLRDNNLTRRDMQRPLNRNETTTKPRNKDN